MPGRPSARSSETSYSSKRQSNQTLCNPRRTTAASHNEIPVEGPSNTLRTQICSIFSDAQTSTVGHRKLVVSLRKLQGACAYEPPVLGNKRPDLEQCGEEEFNIEFARCVIRLMNVKKSEPVGDKTMRFTGLFLKHAGDKDAALGDGGEIDSTSGAIETPTSRLANCVLSLLIQFLTSKEKTVRYRATQMIAHIINSIDALDDEYYHLLKIALLKRIRDKEAMVRVQAVISLGRLAGNEDEYDDGQESDDDGPSGLTEKLVGVLQNDPSADVRRALLLNLPLTASTLPYLLERARDSDAGTRRALYSRLLPALGDFRHLSLSMREKLLRWGLRDRDENVRKATARLFRERWIEDCARPRPQQEDVRPNETSAPNVDALLELLERIDIVNSGIDEGIGGEAMRQFWDGRPDYQHEIVFEDQFWDNLTPESIFIARTWNDFYRYKQDERYDEVMDGKMPEVTRLAFCLEHHINNLTQVLRSNLSLVVGAEEEEEEETAEQEFIVGQLLHIAKTLDYSDEVGRRKMFSLMRETLAIAELPDETTQLVIEVLRDVCGNEPAGERDFCGVVLEGIAEVHDAISIDDGVAENGDERFHSARSEISDETATIHNKTDERAPKETAEVKEAKAIREIMINMKCLHIAQCMLQNVERALHSNMHLITMLNNLVVPAVRSQEAPVRERGLLCLGLCCLLDRNLADENLTLFLHCFNKGHDALQMTAIHTVADILESHPTLFTGPDVEPALHKSVLRMFSKGIKSHQSPDVQSVAATALCKLLLVNVIRDEDLLKQAVICFFDPATSENTAVRQTLSYSLPVYCYSKRENMERMAGIAGSVVHAIVDICEEAGDEEETVGVSKVSSVLVDWTDARKLVVLDEIASSWTDVREKDVNAVNGDPHLTLAATLLDRALTHGCSREDRKALLGMLGKLYISPNSSIEKLQSARDLVAEAIDNKVAGDATSKTALNKLHVGLTKALGEVNVAKKAANEETASPTVMDDGVTAAGHQKQRGLSPVMDEDIEMGSAVADSIAAEQDSMLEELLDDDDDDVL